MRARLINLTPHEVTLVDADGVAVLRIPPSGDVARCQEERQLAVELEVDGVPIAVNRTFFGRLSGLPDPKPGRYLIVSRTASEAAHERDDLLIPDEVVRDEEGRIVGCRSLAQLG